MNESGVMGIGDRVRWARLRAVMTTRQLSEKTGVSAPTLGRIERGRTDARAGDMAKISRALDVSDAWLTFGRGAWKVSS